MVEKIIQNIRHIYENVELEVFAEKMWEMWKRLPDLLQMEEPFYTQIEIVWKLRSI